MSEMEAEAGSDGNGDITKQIRYIRKQSWLNLATGCRLFLCGDSMNEKRTVTDIYVF